MVDGKWRATGNRHLPSVDPATGEVIATTLAASAQDYEAAVASMVQARREWATVLLFMQTVMPKRGEIVRQIGEAFRAKKEPLGKLIALEMGKIKSEGLHEVQETIGICDMACGMSRTIG